MAAGHSEKAKDDSSALGGIDIQDINVLRRNGVAHVHFNEQAVRAVLKNGFTGLTPVIMKVTSLQNSLMIFGASEQGR